MQLFGITSSNFPHSSWQKTIAEEDDRNMSDNNFLRFSAVPFPLCNPFMFIVIIGCDGLFAGCEIFSLSSCFFKACIGSTMFVRSAIVNVLASKTTWLMYV